ncbi:ExbD/TolR family protein [Rhodocyclus gracilis]|uniref:Biopolymer transporter ExbD n=1 Tax=Rhodocyclus tenuis TaxID=1066 RepID=A0A6L5JSC6_RHOTE|nr:biopolymer transporter ExbD [Rhodocyclus gracilis]MQY50275.1 biopolymer transporter ExbD [Rhodocyclus gracilis]
MAFASLDAGDDNAPLAEINMVPLIDVMLVLLIIFIVTAPLLTHAVKLDLPHAASSPNQTQAEHVQVAIDAHKQLFWNGEAVDDATFARRLDAAAAVQPQPELHLRADRTTPYETVAQVMSEVARHGLTRIGFVTDPTTP